MPIRSKAALDAYLAATPAEASVFAPLPPRRRQALIESMEFGERVLRSYHYRLLEGAMTRAQLQAWAAAFDVRLPEFLLTAARADDAPPLREWPIREQLQAARQAMQKDTDDGVRAKLADDAAYAAAVDAAWRRHFGPWQLRMDGDDDFNPDELALLFEAAHETAFYGSQSNANIALRRVFDRLHLAGAATPRQHRDVLARYVAAREFDAARAFVQAHPEATLTAPPSAQALRHAPRAGARRVFDYDPVEDRIVERAVVLPRTGVLVLGSPACHFTVLAGQAIAADPQLRAAMSSTHVLWIAPQDGDFQRDAARDWRAVYPDVAMSPVRDRQEWPEIAQWGTPMFFFYRDGQRIAVIDGWDSDAPPTDALRKALREMGLIR